MAEGLLGACRWARRSRPPAGVVRRERNERVRAPTAACGCRLRRDGGTRWRSRPGSLRGVSSAAP